MKVLLGGIPLGCDNIGDEAIITCVVRMLKESLPNIKLTVATADPGTSERLGVSVVPPYGFAECGLDGFSETVRRHDAYVWCGATGFSDYPYVALDLLEAAQNFGVPKFVWGVGMDDELNPVFFRVYGKKRMLLSLFGLVGWYERRLRARLAHRISRILPRCKGVWLRDPESVEMLATMGFGNAGLAADTAILLGNWDEKTGKREEGNGERGNGQPATFGLCISTQRPVSDFEGLKKMIAAVRATGAQDLGIPMNTKTDRAMLEDIGVV